MTTEEHPASPELVDAYHAVSAALVDDFLCIPPYRITAKFVFDCRDVLREEKSAKGLVTAQVSNPWQRTYQMEYRFKKAAVFDGVLEVIEYATFDAMKGNALTSYLTLLPVIEVLLRRWCELEEVRDVDFEESKPAVLGAAIVKHVRETSAPRSEEHRLTFNGQLHYFERIVCDTLFLGFRRYLEEHQEVFNRNLSLHRLSGAETWRQGLRNTSRLFLLLDVIAELYLMKDPKRLWDITFYANPEADLDFQIRWLLYRRWAEDSLESLDMPLVWNYLIPGNRTDSEKQDAIVSLKAEGDAREALRRLRASLKASRASKSKESTPG